MEVDAYTNPLLAPVGANPTAQSNPGKVAQSVERVNQKGDLPKSLAAMLMICAGNTVVVGSSPTLPINMRG